MLLPGAGEMLSTSTPSSLAHAVRRRSSLTRPPRDIANWRSVLTPCSSCTLLRIAAVLFCSDWPSAGRNKSYFRIGRTNIKHLGVLSHYLLHILFRADMKHTAVTMWCPLQLILRTRVQKQCRCIMHLLTKQMSVKHKHTKLDVCTKYWNQWNVNLN